MFTFGREHEVRCAISNIKTKENQKLAASSVHSGHDYLEENIPLNKLGEILKSNFSNGGSGVWEQAGSWIGKVVTENPTAISWWHCLAAEKSAIVRFRVACFLDEIPKDGANEIGAIFKNDRSKKVKEMAEARMNK